MQSSNFNPESIYELTYMIDERILLMIGVILEVGHLFEFGILYFLLIIMIVCYGKLTLPKEWLCFIFAVSYGIIDEIHQIYVPYRSFSLVDLLKNIVGITAIWYILHRSYFVKRKSNLGSILKQVTNFLAR